MYLLNYRTLFSLLSILIPKSFAPQSHALNVINGNIVALCGIDREVDDESQDVQDTSSPRVLDRSSPCVCYGFGEFLIDDRLHPAASITTSNYNDIYLRRTCQRS